MLCWVLQKQSKTKTLGTSKVQNVRLVRLGDADKALVASTLA